MRSDNIASMVRTQIQLEERQADELRKVATRRGVSVAELVRRGVDKILAEEQGGSVREKRMRAKSVVGKFASGLHDVSTHHDRYLAEAFRK